jgi:NTE family protein
MSIPGAFSPVSLDGRLLVDGGLVDNLPVDVALSMGADIVIAVDIGTPYLPPTKITSMLRIFDQTLLMLTRKNTEENLARAAVIRPT